MRKNKSVQASCVVVRAVMAKQHGNTTYSKQTKLIPIEVDIKRYENGYFVGEYASFCKPEGLVVLPKEMPRYITNDVLQAAPSEKDVIKEIRNLVEDASLEGEYAAEIGEFANLPHGVNEEILMM